MIREEPIDNHAHSFLVSLLGSSKSAQFPGLGFVTQAQGVSLYFFTELSLAPIITVLDRSRQSFLYRFQYRDEGFGVRFSPISHT